MLEHTLKDIRNIQISPLDLLPHESDREKLVSLVINGVPLCEDNGVKRVLEDLAENLKNHDCTDANVVVFGGGTGLANTVGGSSKAEDWSQAPFGGLKETFPKLSAVVCITDDGGSTGELQKDIPLMALGDIRHVLISSIQQELIREQYHLNDVEIHDFARDIAALFNFRGVFYDLWQERETDFFPLSLAMGLPVACREKLTDLFHFMHGHEDLKKASQRNNCLGNLLLASAILRVQQEMGGALEDAVQPGINEICTILGVPVNSVFPCSTTPAQLRIRYTNGVESRGEYKIGTSSRGYPVESINVDFLSKPRVNDALLEKIRQADLLVFAPGSLYSSLIPILKIPAIVSAIRQNNTAQKLLISNIWVQAGETDQSIPDPSRKFYVSDMLRAYEANIHGGTRGIFEEVLCLSLDSVSASVLQRYGVEEKVPIYLDRTEVEALGFTPFESEVFSKKMLGDEEVIQHDAALLSLAVKTLYLSRVKKNEAENKEEISFCEHSEKEGENTYLQCAPSARYLAFNRIIDRFIIDHPQEDALKTIVKNLCWQHKDIQLQHISAIKGIEIVPQNAWTRDQNWDNVLGYYRPDDSYVVMREDQSLSPLNFAFCFLVSLGEALLGNYAQSKEIGALPAPYPGRYYCLLLESSCKQQAFFSTEHICQWLHLAKMNKIAEGEYIRVINKGENFTPPGLLLGLMYAWYLDNRLASHIEYKMSVLKVASQYLIPAQKKMAEKRGEMISFLRDVVFYDNGAF